MPATIRRLGSKRENGVWFISEPNHLSPCSRVVAGVSLSIWLGNSPPGYLDPAGFALGEGSGEDARGFRTDSPAVSSFGRSAPVAVR
jgi:hypothetical protein